MKSRWRKSHFHWGRRSRRASLRRTLTSAKKVALVRLAEQSKQAVYTENEELHDFCELVVQFAFVTFFMPVFPLVGLYALLNNVVEMKTDSFKLINPHGFQRPFARSAASLDVWEQALNLVSMVAVLVNALLITFTSTQMDSASVTFKVWRYERRGGG